jgi:hypothetical protein
MRTEQPWLRSRAAKEKLIPEPAPVIIALCPLTLNACPTLVSLTKPGCLAAMAFSNLALDFAQMDDHNRAIVEWPPEHIYMC